MYDFPLHNIYTGDGLPGNNPETNFGNRLYIISMAPARYDGSPTLGSGYNPFAVKDLLTPSNSGRTPRDHPFTRVKTIDLDGLLGNAGLNLK